MRIGQVITDYIRRSLLTARGDLVVRGAAMPERLVAVALGQVLKSGGVAALPAYGIEHELQDDNAGSYRLHMKTTEITGLAGLTGTWIDAIPVGSLVIGVTARVTLAIVSSAAPHDWDLGHAGTGIEWGQNLAPALGTTSDIADFTVTVPGYFTALTNILISSASGVFSAGNVRLSLYYINLTAPTS